MVFLALLYFNVVINNKSSHRKCSGKKSVLKNFANLTGRHLCWILFLIKLQAFRLKQEIFWKNHILFSFKPLTKPLFQIPKLSIYTGAGPDLFCPYEKLVQLFFHSTSQFLENVIKTSMRSSPKTYPGLLQSKLERFVTIVNGIEQSALHKKWSFPSRNFFSKCDQIRRILRI